MPKWPVFAKRRWRILPLKVLYHRQVTVEFKLLNEYQISLTCDEIDGVLRCYWVLSIDSHFGTVNQSFHANPREVFSEKITHSRAWHRERGRSWKGVVEAEVYEILKSIVILIFIYYGCVRDRGYWYCTRSTGAHSRMPLQRKSLQLQWTRDKVLANTSNGLDFLHNTLKLAHNDINPMWPFSGR